jgi:DNA-binding beta-propeller fold protein YncE
MTRFFQGCVAIFTWMFGLGTALAFQISGMKTPESIIVDPETGYYYVSNINGHPLRKDNSGFISKIGPDGKLIDPHFISGGRKGVHLHAPKGLTLFENHLYVTDIDTVHRFDKATGKLLGSIDFSLLNAKFLNDIATDNNKIYISDTLGNFLYWIEPKNNYSVGILAQGLALGRPNGLVYEEKYKRLLVATWKTGKILSVDQKGNILPVFRKKGLKDLEGIDLDQDGNIIFSSFSEGTIYRLKNYEQLEIIKSGLKTPADISVDKTKKLVLVPSFDGNQVSSFPLSSTK